MIIIFTYLFKRITFITFIINTILLLILFYVVIYIIIQDPKLTRISTKVENLGVQMANYIAKESGSTFKCPKDYIPIQEEISLEANTIYGYGNPTLNTDSQVNVWKYGNIPVDLYTSNDQTPSSMFYPNAKDIPNYRNQLRAKTDNQPNQTFGTTYPSSTYYECKWLGGNSNNEGLPNFENKQYSSIPCQYKQNFQEIGKYICSKDPNTLSATDFNQACDIISS